MQHTLLKRMNCAIVTIVLGAGSIASAQTESKDTRIGKIEIERGYPSQATITRLYDEMDFQRAVQAYLWATPAVAMNSFRLGLERDLGVGYNDIVIFDDFVDPKSLVLTGNSTTLYIVGYLNLERDGPIVLDMPPGLLGMIDDLWEVPIADVGFTGPDKGAGGKFLILPSDYKDAIPDTGYFVLRSSTNLVGFLARGVVKDGDTKSAVDNLRKSRIYSYRQRENPPQTRFTSGSGKALNTISPTGFEYWEQVSAIIDSEPVRTEDRLMMAMLAPLGIEKGKPFKPDARQRALLTEAATMGNAMAKTLSYASRNPVSLYYPGKHWRLNFEINPEMENKYSTQLDERTAYTYSAIWVARGMILKTPGAGSQYLTAFQDKDGDWLDGGNPYRLRVPANVPAKLFWSVTLYDSDTRSMVQTDQNLVAKSSYDKLKTNSDGSTDLFFGPTAPAGFEDNWIKTATGRGFFAMFRWYGPTEPFFDKSWSLPDVEKERKR